MNDSDLPCRSIPYNFHTETESFVTSQFYRAVILTYPLQ